MLEVFVVPRCLLVLNKFEGRVGYPWFFGLRWYLGECVSGCFLYGMCDRVGLGGGLGVADFDEVEKEGIIPLMERGPTYGSVLGSALVG